jgi:hypothetical protein
LWGFFAGMISPRRRIHGWGEFHGHFFAPPEERGNETLGAKTGFLGAETNIRRAPPVISWNVWGRPDFELAHHLK